MQLKNRTLILSLLLLLMLFPIVSGGCRQESAAWKRIEQEGVLRVGLDPTYPPFETTTDTSVAGFDVDLADALAAELGLQTEFVFFGYDGLYDALTTKQVDVLISALVIMPSRTRDFAYSAPYFNAGQVLVVPTASDAVQDMADLAGRTLAVELGAQGHVEGTQWEKRVRDLTILPLTTADEALATVAERQSDAALVDGISSRLFLAAQSGRTPQLKILDPPVTVEPFAMVVRIEDETLLEKLDEALSALEANGQLKSIRQQWLGG